jgi:hypothetical protein
VSATPSPWLLLIHQLPPTPSYLRVKVWRRLQAVGAVAIKNSVYVLPRNDETREDLEWILREIRQDGGEGSICEAQFVDGLRDEQIEALFHAARDADYGQLATAARDLARGLPRRRALSDDRRRRLEGEVTRLRKRLTEVVAIDFFGAPGREAAEGLLTSVETRTRAADTGAPTTPRLSPDEYRGRTWVTRKDIHVDRIASAWLIRRFIDADATFKFVAAKGYAPEPGELRFDMFDAEFTHDGDRCTFEVLAATFRPDDTALRGIAEVIHDIDLKDGKYERPATAGIDLLVAAITIAHRADEDRLTRGAALLDDLYEYVRSKHT